MRRHLLGVLIAISTLAVVASAAAFAPFDNEGLASFRVAGGAGDADTSDGNLAWTAIEADPLFHSLSSRFGGGGVLVYIEYEPVDGHSGLLIIDLRHAGFPDLVESHLTVPNRRRAEIYYQEWDGSRDLFESSRVEGDLTIVEMYRGQGISALGLRFDLFVLDGADQWRRVVGSATTSPTVEQAVIIERDVVYTRRDRGEVYAPDGDIYVDCYGDAHVVEEEYDEDSYYYEDGDGGGCSGDTWDDDTEDPQESGGCAGERTVDDGEPDPDGGCESSGDEIAPDEYEDDSSWYEGDDVSDGQSSGCDEDSSSSDSSSGGCDSDDSGDSSSGPSCEGDTAEAAVAPQDRGHLRRYLGAMGTSRHKRQLAGAAGFHRFEAQTARTVRRLSSWLPFFLLAVGIRAARRRLRGAC